jgi:hypothetical protein
MSSISPLFIAGDGDGDCMPGIFISVLVGAGVGEGFGFVVWACSPATANSKKLSRAKCEHTAAQFRAAIEQHVRTF